MDYCFGIYINVFRESLERFDAKLHAFVLMNNHFHLIVSTPQKNIGDFLKYFMTQTSKGISKKSGRINHIYGGRNHKNIIQTSEYYAHCIKYVYRNPVKAKICKQVEDYPWSTISGKPNMLQPLVSPVLTGHEEYLPKSLVGQLEWYNEALPEDLEKALTQAMRRPIFTIKSSQKTKKVLDLNQWLHSETQY